MTEILRSLDLLVTSRYHAAVLSLEAKVPQIAVGHDPRLKGLYKDLGMENEYLIDYLSAEKPGEKIWKQLSRSVDELLDEPLKMYDTLNKGYNDHLKRSNENHLILKEFLKEKGWDVKNEG
jgi:polysaccharide pyruvyl transferase WcaK-like protein